MRWYYEIKAKNGSNECAISRTTSNKEDITLEITQWLFVYKKIDIHIEEIPTFREPNEKLEQLI